MKIEILRRISWGVVLAMTGMAALLADAGIWMRPMTDDYLLERYLDKLGGFQTALWWYQEWQGRWVSQFVVNALYGTGYWFIPVLPVILAMIWGGGIYRVARQLGAGQRLSLGISGTILGLTFYLTPDLITSFYWAAASLYHCLPMVLAPWLVLLVISESTNPFRLAAVALLGVAISGMSELFDVWLVPALFLLAVLRREKYSWAAFGATALGLATVVASPGSHKRSAVYPGHMSVGDSLGQAVHWCGFLWERLLRWELLLGLVATFCLAYACGLEQEKWRPGSKGAALCAVLGAGSTYLCLFLVMLATHGTPPQIRVYTVPAFLAVAGLITAAAQIGLWCRHRWAARPLSPALGIGLAVAAILVLPFTLSTVGHRMSEMRRFATAWQARDTSLRGQVAAGRKDLYCKRLPVFQYDIALDPKFYVNVYMAYHYTHDDKARVILIPDGK